MRWAGVIAVLMGCPPALGAEEPVERRYEASTARERAEGVQRRAEADAAAAGWMSEAFHEKTQGNLKRLAGVLVDGGGGGEFFVAGAVVRVMEPWEVAGRDGRVQVRRGVGNREVDAVEGLSVLCGGDVDAVRFKQVGVELAAGGGGTTRVLFKARGGGRVRHGEAEFEWDGDGLIVAFRVVRAEEIVREGEALFVDRTEAVLAAAGGWSQVRDWGGNRVSEQMVSESSRLLVGIALGDANGDGWDDVFVPQTQGLPNLYYLSDGAGGFVERGAEAGLAWLDRTASGLWIDFDNDGDQDLAVATSGLLVFLENVDAGRRFERRGAFAQEDSSALCAADYDGDGRVDVFLGNYLAEELRTSVADPASLYDADGGGSNRLYRNHGEWEFEDVTAQVGLDAGATRLTLAAAWEDFDQDGDADLYVANDFGPNGLYRNDGGRFIEVAAGLGADDPSTGMSVAWADVDGDGWTDVAVANMYSSAGNRVVPQVRFRELLPEGLEVARVQYLAGGNALLLNRGGGRFENVGVEAGIANTQWTWGMLAADVNHSGWPDLLAVNGFLTGPDEDDL